MALTRRSKFLGIFRIELELTCYAVSRVNDWPSSRAGGFKRRARLLPKRISNQRLILTTLWKLTMVEMISDHIKNSWKKNKNIFTHHDMFGPMVPSCFISTSARKRRAVIQADEGNKNGFGPLHTFSQWLWQKCSLIGTVLYNGHLPLG